MDGARCSPSSAGNSVRLSNSAGSTGTSVHAATNAEFQESVAVHFKAAQQALALHLEAAASLIAKRFDSLGSLEKQVATLEASYTELQEACKSPYSSSDCADNPVVAENRAVPGKDADAASDSSSSVIFSAAITRVTTPLADALALPAAPESPTDVEATQALSSAETAELTPPAVVVETTEVITGPAGDELAAAPGYVLQNGTCDAANNDSRNGTKQVENSRDNPPRPPVPTRPPISIGQAFRANSQTWKDDVTDVSQSSPAPLGRRISVASANSASTCRSQDSFYQVLPHWIMRSGSTSRSERRSSTSKITQITLSSMGSSATLDLAEGSSNKDERFDESARSCAIRPHTARRGVWDVMSFAFVLYDMIVIPLAFLNPPDLLLFEVMSWATRLFWTMDIAMSFCTGYMKPTGALELRCYYVVKRYLQTWFSLDLFIVLLDWTELVWSGSNNAGYARLGKASRVFRVVRMLRLLRILRARKLMMIITARIQSERLIIMAHMVQLMLVLIGCSHLSACIWYGIGNASDPDNSWVETFFTEEDHFGYRYFSSLHWSLCQFTGGMDEIRPTSMSERIFNILMFIVAFVMAAVFVSHLTSSMTQLNMMSSQQLLNLAALRRFLLENGISDLLSRRIQHSAKFAMKEQQRITPEGNVELLKTVSGVLRVELHFELYSPFLSTHPFFSRYMVDFPNSVRRVCHEAMCIKDYLKGDDVFSDGELPLNPTMYIVHSGRFIYERTFEVGQVLEHGLFLSEAAIWTRWRHKGTLTAASYRCRLCTLDSHKFQQIVRSFRKSGSDGMGPKEYANMYVEELNQRGLDGDVSDLPFEIANLKPARRESLQPVMPWLNSGTITALDHRSSIRSSGGSK